MDFFKNLFDAFSKPTLSDPVKGSAQVVSASMPPHKSGGGGMCVMNLVITIPGHASVAVRKASLVRLHQWPMPGTVLPVMAERNDPQKYVILWDEVPSSATRATQQAQQVADLINAAKAGAPPTGASAGTNASTSPLASFLGMASSVTINGKPASAETLAGVEAMIGVDLNGDGKIGGASTSSSAAPGSSTSADERLRRLQKLRDGGLISEAEYQTKRAEIVARL